MRAIETEYLGYRFRSRLEARWAVFFDGIGARWEYEREGYHTKAGPYLPDFFLHLADDDYDRRRWPGAGHWFEIKPVLPSPDECEKLMDVVRQTHHFARFLIGPPDEFSESIVGGHSVGPVEFGNEWLYGTFVRYASRQDPRAISAAVRAAMGARFERRIYG